MTSVLTIGIIIAVIVGSMIFASYMYYEYQPNFIVVESGQPVQVGPVIYIVKHLGMHDGDDDIKPEDIFFKIQIIAENVGPSTTLLSGGQFYLLDETDYKHRAVYGEFSDEDLFNDDLKPNESLTRTTQFDIPFDEEMIYRVGILPTKEQSSNDIGIVCVLNC
ncbi:MAG TPA: DUF4352 domain-containing protein [Nitrosopumilaceae archaeon]|nr:DUF4352 domain-containing protein [Nitrosopumilaceae archaeon]